MRIKPTTDCLVNSSSTHLHKSCALVHAQNSCNIGSVVSVAGAEFPSPGSYVNRAATSDPIDVGDMNSAERTESSLKLVQTEPVLQRAPSGFFTGFEGPSLITTTRTRALVGRRCPGSTATNQIASRRGIPWQTWSLRPQYIATMGLNRRGISWQDAKNLQAQVVL